MTGQRTLTGIILATALWNAAVAAQEPAADWTLLYTATRDGSNGLYLLDAAGERRLTAAAASDNWGAWSPDGGWIAFQSQRDGNYEVYRMRADGSAVENLSRHEGHDGLPVWSPDGTELAFFSSRGLEVREGEPIPGHIYVMAAAGGELRRVTSKPLSSTLGPSAWSPDGGRLLLSRVIDGDADLLELDLATGGERVLVATPTTESRGLYSPDGRSIAYYSADDEGAALMLVPAAGGAPTALRAGDGSWYPYAWSPDGEWISTTWVGADGTWELRAVRADGSAHHTVMAGEERPREGSWRP